MPPPPRRQQQEESDESEGEDYGGAVDFTRFTNPNYAREFKAKLPEKIRDRVKALEALDEDYKALRLEMRNAMEAAEKEFQLEIQPQIAARNKILSGEVEPTDDEVTAGIPEELKSEIQLTGIAGESKGIPNFWLGALRHHVIIREFITDRDQEALRFLEEISCTLLAAPEEGYTITFRFAENPFFTNSALSKSFTLSRQQDDIVLSKSTGTEISWKEGKNLGMRTVTKKMKNKAKKGQFKFVTTEEPCETFFHFFSNGADGEEGDDEEWMALADTLKEKIIPFAVEYFTGEAPDGESDMEDEDYGDEEEEEEEEEEEPAPAPRGRGGYQAPGGKRGGAGGRGGQQQDCKQQ